MENILMPEAILDASTRIFRNAPEIFYRNGVPIQKGAVLSKRRIRNYLNIYQSWMEHFINYPDTYLDLLKPTTSKF